MADKMDEMLEDRRVQHGDFSDHARIAQELKDVMRKEIGWGTLTPTQKEGLEMIQHKIARVLAGNPDFSDHWKDIAGYAQITEQRLTKRSEPDYTGGRKPNVSVSVSEGLALSERLSRAGDARNQK